MQTYVNKTPLQNICRTDIFANTVTTSLHQSFYGSFEMLLQSTFWRIFGGIVEILKNIISKLQGHILWKSLGAKITFTWFFFLDEHYT